jgi:hypothetical protein
MTCPAEMFLADFFIFSDLKIEINFSLKLMAQRCGQMERKGFYSCAKGFCSGCRAGKRLLLRLHDGQEKWFKFLEMSYLRVALGAVPNSSIKAVEK